MTTTSRSDRDTGSWRRKPPGFYMFAGNWKLSQCRDPDTAMASPLHKPSGSAPSPSLKSRSPNRPTFRQLGFTSTALGQNLPTLVVGELAPLADFFRRAQAPNAQVRLPIGLADIKTRRRDCHGSHLRGFGFQFRRRGDRLFRRWQEAGRVQDEDQLRHDMDACRQQRVQEAEGSQRDAKRVDTDRSGEILPR